jgi:hypothetical protein
MSDSAEQPQEPSAARGEAAWKEATAQIAARNDRARKEGKARRAAYEAERNAARRKRERQEIEGLLNRREKP